MRSRRAAATLAMFLAWLPRRAMMASLAAPIAESRGIRWMASMTAQRSARERRPGRDRRVGCRSGDLGEPCGEPTSADVRLA